MGCSTSSAFKAPSTADYQLRDMNARMRLDHTTYRNHGKKVDDISTESCEPCSVAPSSLLHSTRSQHGETRNSSTMTFPTPGSATPSSFMATSSLDGPLKVAGTPSALTAMINTEQRENDDRWLIQKNTVCDATFVVDLE